MPLELWMCRSVHVLSFFYHLKNPYLCVGFTTAAYLRVHARNHHGVHYKSQRFVCEQCGLQCQSHNHLIGHKKSHMGETPTSSASSVAAVALKGKHLHKLHLEKAPLLPGHFVTKVYAL